MQTDNLLDIIDVASLSARTDSFDVSFGDDEIASASDMVVWTFQFEEEGCTRFELREGRPPPGMPKIDFIWS